MPLGKEPLRGWVSSSQFHRRTRCSVCRRCSPASEAGPKAAWLLGRSGRQRRTHRPLQSAIPRQSTAESRRSRRTPSERRAQKSRRASSLHHLRGTLSSSDCTPRLARRVRVSWCRSVASCSNSESCAGGWNGARLSCARRLLTCNARAIGSSPSSASGNPLCPRSRTRRDGGTEQRTSTIRCFTEARSGERDRHGHRLAADQRGREDQFPAETLCSAPEPVPGVRYHLNVCDAAPLVDCEPQHDVSFELRAQRLGRISAFRRGLELETRKLVDAFL